MQGAEVVQRRGSGLFLESTGVGAGQGRPHRGSGRWLGFEQRPRFTRWISRWGGKRYSRGGGGSMGLGGVSYVVWGCCSIGYGQKG